MRRTLRARTHRSNYSAPIPLPRDIAQVADGIHTAAARVLPAATGPSPPAARLQRNARIVQALRCPEPLLGVTEAAAAATILMRNRARVRARRIHGSPRVRRMRRALHVAIDASLSIGATSLTAQFDIAIAAIDKCLEGCRCRCRASVSSRRPSAFVTLGLQRCVANVYLLRNTRARGNRFGKALPHLRTGGVLDTPWRRGLKEREGARNWVVVFNNDSKASGRC